MKPLIEIALWTASAELVRLIVRRGWRLLL